APPSKRTIPDALAPRIPVTSRPLMSSPATLTLAMPHSRCCCCGGGSSAPLTRSTIENTIVLPPAVVTNEPPDDCTCNEYSPGVTPFSVNWPSPLGGAGAPGAQIIAQRL